MTELSAPGVIDWTSGLVRLVLDAEVDRPVALRSAVLAGTEPAAREPRLEQPLVELSTIGTGRSPGGFRHVDTVLGRALRHRAHHVTSDGPTGTLVVEQVAADHGLVVRSHFQVRQGVPAFRTWTTVGVEGPGELLLDSVSILATGAWLPDSGGSVDEVLLTHAANDWVAESRWRTDPLREIGLARMDRDLHGNPPRGRAVVTNRGSWSTGEQLPTAVLHRADESWGIGWQIEHNGPWLYELGETRHGAYLLLSGPTDQEHQWVAPVSAGAEVRTPTASVALAPAGGLPVIDRVLQAMTDQRRAIRLPRAVDDALPVGFNDYMNTLMGDPTTEKLLPLIDAAAQVGADLFCVDAGWYSDGHWWDSVGEWQPAPGRFPGGLQEVIDRIRSHGMTAGLWLEPEVIGVRSPLATTLPDSAFIRRFGQRYAEHGRHLLDLRSPDARAHLDSVVDRLVSETGVAFFKMDCNTMVGAGSDEAPDGTRQAPGLGAAEHAAALLEWLDAVQARHPRLIIENCASGAMRMDYAMLARLHLQSTSDQQDPVRYAPIAALAPASILPEQAGNWAYPESGASEERFVLSLANAVLGRMYLSGYLNRMTAPEVARVAEAVRAQKALLPDIRRARPFWPLGLPAWESEWVALGLDAGLVDGAAAHVTLWRRGDSPASTVLRLPQAAGRELDVAPFFPADLPGWTWRWDTARGELHVATTVAEPSARVLRLTLPVCARPSERAGLSAPVRPARR